MHILISFLQVHRTCAAIYRQYFLLSHWTRDCLFYFPLCAGFPGLIPYLPINTRVQSCLLCHLRGANFKVNSLYQLRQFGLQQNLPFLLVTIQHRFWCKVWVAIFLLLVRLYPGTWQHHRVLSTLTLQCPEPNAIHCVLVTYPEQLLANIDRYR